MPWSMSVGGQVPWVLDGASVVGQDVGAGGCGGVVGVGVVEMDLRSFLRLKATNVLL